MKHLLHILLLLTVTSSFAQNTKYQFAKEVFRKEVFRKEYKPQAYEPFNGKVTVGDNTIQYGEQVLVLYEYLKEYKEVFIHHPNLFADDHVVKYKKKDEVAAMTEQEKFSYVFGKNDTIKIVNFEQLEDLNPNVKTKRFLFWRYYGNVINPTEIYFELQNNKATRRTPLDEFIKGAKLTFYHNGRIIL